MKTLLIFLALVFSSIAAAQPTQNNICTNCHTSEDTGGQISVSDTSIDIGLDSMGALTFNITGGTSIFGAGSIALFGLDDASLMATAGTGWVDNITDGGYWYSFPYIEEASIPTSYSLTLSVPDTALLDTYPISVIFAGREGGTRWFDTTSFNVNVVPIPPAVWLFGSGLLGLIWIARRRRNT